LHVARQLIEHHREKALGTGTAYCAAEKEEKQEKS